MAKFRAAAVFSSNMVLQRDKCVKVFGYGKDGDTVTVTFNGHSATAVVRGESWCVQLPPMTAGGPYEMKISDGETEKVFYNIMVGEVWLAGGQSNMELELQNCKGGKETLETDKDTNVRFYYTQKNCYMDDKFYADEENTGWSEFNSESAKAWSAVGYFFARELAAKLGVTVGLIGCNWGGTSASYWMSRESLEKDIETKAYLDDYDNAIAGKTEEELRKEYQEYIEYDNAWHAKSMEVYAKNPKASWDEVCAICGPNKYPGPHAPMNPFHATALYDSMIKRVCPYTIKGFIYYQGETDDCRPNTYFKLFKGLIQLWRDDWGDDELPFMFVQLPMHRYEADPDYKHWCIIREAQMRVYETVKNTGVAVIIDCGEFNEIHPKDKLPVGHRLYLQAMYHVYGDKDIDAFGPLYDYHIYESDSVKVYFKHADGGFEVRGDNGLTGFEVAGEDKQFVPAEAVINTDNTITVRAAEVKAPMYVRYLWTNYSDVALYGKNGIPAAPFRTSRNDNVV
ncbi:MAG: sialate O-acetylesterase [Eubacterium sp.]|nr:sialate O-acetylesterase [Eubacterium sp.]